MRIACLLLFSAISVAQDRTDLVKEYIRSFNSGEDAMKSFFGRWSSSDTPIEVRLGRYREMRERLKSLELVRVVDGRMPSALIRSASGEVGTYEFRLTPADPPKLLGVMVRIGGDGDDGPPPAGPPLAEDAALKEIRSVIDKASAADRFSGAVLIAREGSPVLQAAKGLADRERKTPNSADTRFNMGSITKILTKAAIAQLWKEGKIGVDDKLVRFLPDYPNKAVAEKITIGQLLSMRSGIGDFFGPKYDVTSKKAIRTLADYLPLFANEPLLFEPGTSESYSNGGYVVLGLVIEKITGRSYYDYMQETILNRLGMKNSGWYESDSSVANRVRGYHGADRRLNTDTLSQRGSSAGGSYSTPGDLLLLGRAIEQGRLTPADAPSVMRVPNGIGVAGGAPGLNAALETMVGRGYTLVVMANYDPPSATDLAREISAVLRRVK